MYDNIIQKDAKNEDKMTLIDNKIQDHNSIKTKAISGFIINKYTIVQKTNDMYNKIKSIETLFNFSYSFQFLYFLFKAPKAPL